MIVYLAPYMGHNYRVLPPSTPPSPISGCSNYFFFLFFFQEGNRILSRKKLALKKRSFVNLYNTGVIADLFRRAKVPAEQIR